MKILHVNTYDKGGAATAIKRIHKELLNKGIDSKLLVLHKTANFPETYSFWEGIPKLFPKKQNLIIRVGKKIWKKIYDKVYRLFNKKKIADEIEKKKKLNTIISQVEMFSYPISNFDITEHPLYKEADIIQLNWVSGFLDEPSFFSKNKKPVVWRMPDLYVCGGGYHYEKGFLFDELKEEVDENVKIRMDVFKDASQITFVPISNWLKMKADESIIIKNFDKKVIHNGLDLNVFKPMNKLEARLLFNLPIDKKIVLFGSQQLKNIRKGFQLLIDSIQYLKIDDILYCTFGEEVASGNEQFINLGTITDERLLCMLYSAADLFIMPSIEEAFGQVTIEALACGLPVVSFQTGGSQDIIQNGINGFFAKEFTAKSLAEAIKLSIDFPFDKEIIKKDIENRFNIKEKTEEYHQLYKNILNEHK